MFGLRVLLKAMSKEKKNDMIVNDEILKGGGIKLLGLTFSTISSALFI